MTARAEMATSYGGGELAVAETLRPSGSRYTTRGRRRDRSDDLSRSVIQKEALDFGDSEESSLLSATHQEQKVFLTKKRSVKLVVWIVRVLFMVSVLTCLVMSKLTILKMLSELYVVSAFTVNASSAVPATENPHITNSDVTKAVRMYWQLFFVIMIPNVIAWLRSFYYGVLNKSHWPTNGAIFVGIASATIEAGCECFLFFYVFLVFPPSVVVFLMSGISFGTAIYQTYKLGRYCGRRAEYEAMHNTDENHVFRKLGSCVRSLLIGCNVVGGFLQIAGIIAISILISLFLHDSKAIITTTVKWSIGCVLCLCLLLLSVIWSSALQKWTFTSRQPQSRVRSEGDNHNTKSSETARYKASFLAISARLLVYPIVSYVVFLEFYTLSVQHQHHIADPWCFRVFNPSCNLTDPWEMFKWEKEDIILVVHVVTSFLAYVLSWIACYMTLHVSGMAIPLLLSTPITVGVYFLTNSNARINNFGLHLFPFTKEDSRQIDYIHTVYADGNTFTILIFFISLLVWIGQLLVTTYRTFVTKNSILAYDEDMFVRPYYNSILLEQSLGLNRCAAYKPHVQDGVRAPCTVFICSTMFRESLVEMKQMLISLHRVAKHYSQEIERNMTCDKFESHIFFDGGCIGDELSEFAIQLMSLVPRAMDVEWKDAIKIATPYGYRLKWLVEDHMWFTIHLKDNNKVRNKKRWSQVMYMNYIMEYRAVKDDLDLNNTFILTTDADIDFRAESAIVLLDMLARDPHVGAVCSRTHPLGSGIFYWYQIFDYAVGHWLQKCAEHIFGSVLCCPGCFSIFRCSALNDCLPMYSTEVNNAVEFLMKDMGEDRWLCTLLVEKGWRLEYCAISNDYTYCPVEFDEFYKQRRRWIPSTVANLWLLIANARKIIQRNKSINWLFIVYEMCVILSTVIAPATVILVIATGLSSAFPDGDQTGNNGLELAAIILMILVSLFYGLVCIYGSQKTQLDVAKILTVAFAVVMAIVISGIIMGTVKTIFPDDAMDGDDDRNSTGRANAGSSLPVSETIIYIATFAAIFVTTAILHFFEFITLFHSLWYLLGLPSGYLLLLIYSFANLNSRSWGTREKKDANAVSIFSVLWAKVRHFILKYIGKVDKSKEEQPEGDIKIPVKKHHGPQGFSLEERPSEYHEYPWIYEWLKDNQAELFYEAFVSEGYTDTWYVAGMSTEELKDIGVAPQGYIRHLQKAIKKLPIEPLEFGIPKTLRQWLVSIKMNREEDDYLRKFNRAGYYDGDVENLTQITDEELINDIQVTKKAHIKRFKKAIKLLRVRSPDEEQMVEAKLALQSTNDHPPVALDSEEVAFWMYRIDHVLYPTPDSLTQADTLRDDLLSLRNSAIMAMLLINLIWLVGLYLLKITKLESFGLNSNLLGLLFIAVYGLLLVSQFCAMLLHRLVTLAHYIARLNRELPVENNQDMTTSNVETMM